MLFYVQTDVVVNGDMQRPPEDVQDAEVPIAIANPFEIDDHDPQFLFQKAQDIEASR